ncbi:Fc receptor-like protein 3 [Kryptolebias marmoratus]|uniref:Fc receptor-like protein 3 n=1 Tax=Kryptolebias marmoratus TaxID=37003 RepID=UPI0018AD03C0|nr:Fc receptor-like protein 3 [Kryptolebias marmoratus]
MNTWRVKKKLHKVSPETSSETCNTSGPSCTVDPILERHSGEYWCENDEGEATNAVNISVTAGLVILDIPARPVMEGSDLTLWCLNKKTDQDHISDFYKDGALLSTSYKSNFTIQNVSKSDEGRYKCSISGKGDSPESRLAVFKPDEGVDEETQHLHSHSTKIIILRSILVLLLVIIGLIVCRKHKG